MVTIARAELGDDVLTDHRRLAEAVAEPARQEEGADVYPGLVPKAAALLLVMLRLRPFARANAKVSLLATTVFLNRNGLDLQAVGDELIAVVAVAATGELSVHETAAALEGFVVRLTQPME